MQIRIPCVQMRGGTAQVRSAAMIRTARWLFDGNVRVPQRVWPDKKAA